MAVQRRAPAVDESQLTPGQRKWLEASRKIGPGPMTKSERLTLERLYAELLPREQQELQEYIRAVYGKKEDPTSSEDTGGEPTARMEQRTWSSPSSALKDALSRASMVRPSKNKEESSGDPS